MDYSVEKHYQLMGITYRHTEILAFFDSLFVRRSIQRELWSAREQIALIKNNGKLIDLDGLNAEQKEKIAENINRMKFTYPDYMVFKENPKLMNEHRTRVAGTPDLIIEVWSPFNSPEEKSEKRHLFIAPKSEFWELDQNSLKILCWKPNGSSYIQYLNRTVKTPWGEELDLTPLALDAEVEDTSQQVGDKGIDIEL